ncbi:MAG: nickel-dependent hydrogenase large subunit [Firmicutes bacterium]|nr:nickel-dependent hydrogenase large subunit [Bacillota bacterium]
MGRRTILPFGPQHPVLPEPIHLDLILEDEVVVEAVPSIGYIHRGLEKLVEKKDFQEYVHVAERICGICSFMHGMGYCMAVERTMGVKVPERAEFLRTVWAELSRVHSHLMWLGLLADALGFESLFMHCWRLREYVLDIFDMTTGGRVIFSVCKLGGVRKDISRETMMKILDTFDKIEGGIKEITRVFTADASVSHRLTGLGALTGEDARSLGAVGPMARASGVGEDARAAGYAAYPYVKFGVQTDTAGDCMARVKVRTGEIFEAIGIIRQCAELMPDGPTDTKVTGFPSGEAFARLEQPRGEVLYYVKGGGTKFLERFRVRTPTFANLAALLEMLKGVELADVPALVLTIDPCISCTER